MVHPSGLDFLDYCFRDSLANILGSFDLLFFCYTCPIKFQLQINLTVWLLCFLILQTSQTANADL